MSILDFDDGEAFGHVQSVDTAMVVVSVDDVETLRKLGVNRLVALQSSVAGHKLVGVISKITRNAAPVSKPSEGEQEEIREEMNLVRITLIGTLVNKLQGKDNVFQRTLETVPEIDALCFAIEGDRLTQFMQVISQASSGESNLSLGVYTLDPNAEAFLNGNRFFQRHALLVGSTGSGKSWTTAKVVEQIASLPSANALVFDIHGEYKSLEGEEFEHLKVAGPGDVSSGAGLEDGILHLPYWLLSYEAMVTMFVDRSDQNAPNQTMLMSRSVIAAKRRFLEAGEHADVLANFTIDSPVPYSIDELLDELKSINEERVPGARGDKNGEFHGKLSRLIQRLEAKLTDRRLGFLFPKEGVADSYEWLTRAVTTLVGSRSNKSGAGGVKIIDFSEVPSDILPLIIGMVARLIFLVQQWSAADSRHPIAIICDEAHLYVPDNVSSGAAENAIEIFERVAKEGRKYGVALVIVSQRPAEVNRTVVSQCNNLIAMRLTNGEDQAVVRRLLPSGLGNFGDILPILDTGEALVIGDASLLPTRIRVSRPRCKPLSGTVDFWDEWSSPKSRADLAKAIEGWRQQKSVA